MAGRKKLRDSAGRSGTVFLRSRVPHFDRKIRKLQRNRKRRNYQRNTGAGKNFSLALFYLAGMYRYPALLVLAVHFSDPAGSYLQKTAAGTFCQKDSRSGEGSSFFV